MFPHYKLEKKLLSQGYQYIAGVDEVGRGAWAGPIVAAAVVFPPEVGENSHSRPKIFQEIRDSKLLTPKRREELFAAITDVALDWAVGLITNQRIDRIGINQANYLVIKKAVSNLKAIKPHYVLVDYYTFSHWRVKHRGVPYGDQQVISIAAASIIAKVYRDRWMVRRHKQFPHYGFARHKGYGTKKHLIALKTHGPCILHRYSYMPVKLSIKR